MFGRLASLCSLLVVLASGQSVRADAAGERVSRGMKLLQMQGCTGCHSLDGSISAGPTLMGRFGRPTSVMVGNVRREVVFDRPYLQSALEDPGAALAPGFAPGVMPRFALTDEQIDAIAAALEHLATPPATSESGPISWLIASIALGASLAGCAGVWLHRRSRRQG